jgi:hypothetical protein
VTITIAQILAFLPVVGTMIAMAIKIGRAYGREEAMRAKYEQQVDELRKTQARHGGRLQALERVAGRRGGGDGE